MTSTIIPLVTVLLLIVSTLVADKLMHVVGYEPAGAEALALTSIVFFTIGGGLVTAVRVLRVQYRK